MAIDPNYLKIQLEYRTRFLQLQKSLEKEYSQIATELGKRIQAVIDKYTDKNGMIKKTAIDDINRELDQVARWFTLTATKWLDNNITQSIGLATTGQDAAAMYYIKALMAQNDTLAGLLKSYPVTLQQQYGSGLNGLTKIIRDQVWQKRWRDGFHLSDRIWVVDSTLRQELHSMVEQCVNQGISAVEFSRAVENYLEVPGPKWTTAIKRAKTERGTLRFNSLRLARTETTAAYRAAHKMSVANSAIVKGVRWTLSRSHPKYDICDEWAKDDSYGLGPGGYPVDKLPPGHPQCLCIWLDILREGSDLISALKQKYSKAS